VVEQLGGQARPIRALEASPVPAESEVV